MGAPPGKPANLPMKPCYTLHHAPLLAAFLACSLLLASCTTTSKAPDAASEEEATEDLVEVDAATAQDSEVEPPEEPAARPARLEPIAEDVSLPAAEASEFVFVPGDELGMPEPESWDSEFGYGVTHFAYPCTSLGGRAGREILLVLMNVESGDRIELPSRRVRVVFVGSEERATPAEVGIVEVQVAGAGRLAGHFEVRFDTLASVIVRGTFDSARTPAR